MPPRKKDLFDRPMDSFSLRFFVVPSDLVGRSHLLVIGGGDIPSEKQSRVVS